VVVTFGPEGGYGHPDHIAVSQWTAAAIVQAADAGYGGSELPPHTVAKFYYKVWVESEQAAYTAAFGEAQMEVDGMMRGGVAWPDWALTTWLDTETYWQVGWRASLCHESQMRPFPQIANLPAEIGRAIWGREGYYRVMSLVNGGRGVEADLFEGLPD
jgi:LmbE family N-acetylglucosaminyl deacetylase